jgi:polar amino acid transport system substrate-binding protein
MLKAALATGIIVIAGAFGAAAQKGEGMSISETVVNELAPTGTLRVGLNFGNIVLVQGTIDAPRGVTPELARALGKRLNVPIAFIPFDAAGRTFEALKNGALDIAFLAIEPARAAEIEFTPPYVLIEGVYLVLRDSPLTAVADVDRDGVRIGVAKDSAYDLFLTRRLKHAKLVRGESGIDRFVNEKLAAAAGVKQPMVLYAKAHPEVRLIDGRFMEIRQAMCTRKGRPAGARYLSAFIEEMKASGFIADALKRSNQPDAAVAPAQ